jgi:hypothetical protein
MPEILFAWQQELMERLTASVPDPISCWYVAPKSGLGKTWMTHHLGDAHGALNTYPLDAWPLAKTVQAVRHYVEDGCSCGCAGYHRFALPGDVKPAGDARKTVVFDMHAGRMLALRLQRVVPFLAGCHVVVLADRPPDKATLALREWEIVPVEGLLSNGPIYQ